LLLMYARNSAIVGKRRPTAAASSYASCQLYGLSSVLKKNCNVVVRPSPPPGPVYPTSQRQLSSAAFPPAETACGGHSVHTALPCSDV
jgi:hypothetical protein